MVNVAAKRIAAADPAAAQLIHLASFCGPEPAPLWLFAESPPDILPDPLASAAADPLRLRRAVGLLTRLGLQ